MSVGKPEFVLRFAVGDEGGVRSALWRIWKPADKDDIYIAPSGITSDGNIAGIAKISLHGSRRCSFGFTSQYQKRVGGSGRDRSVISWQRREGLADGYTNAVSILIVRNFLSSQATPYGKEMQLIAIPKERGAVVIDFLFSRVAAERLLLLPHQFELCRLALSTGELVQVIAGCCEDFDESQFLRDALPLHQRTTRLGRWKEPNEVPAHQLRGAVAKLDERTATLRIVDVGHEVFGGDDAEV